MHTDRPEKARALALEVGFDLVGIARAEPSRELSFFPQWIAEGKAGEMTYLTSQVEKRSDLRRPFPWARSVICVGLQYDTPSPYSTDTSEGGWVSRYAWGDDYHDVMGALLKTYEEQLHGVFGPFEARAYVDTGPLVERAYAAEAGLGAWGKNTCLLHPEHGSWFFLGEVVTSLTLEPDQPRPDMCGSCRACLDACPTGALPAPFVLDATRCISYLTIELKGPIPEDQREGVSRHVFGCDICQDVCPWNRKRRLYGGAPFAPREGLAAPDLLKLAGLDEAGYRSLFRKSPLRRAKRRGFLRNVAVALGNSGNPAARPALERLAEDPDTLVREHARWALERLTDRP
jgi:epoxyqueuosine reductase